MHKLYLEIEKIFEKLTEIVTKTLGNPITFIIALCMVLIWWATSMFSGDMHQNIGDIIFGVTFLSLFIIQKSFNRYSALVHLKMNELISSHEMANNDIIHSDKKTEKEIIELYNEYIEENSDILDILEKNDDGI
jgi:low affinity Fe/Cu permease